MKKYKLCNPIHCLMGLFNRLMVVLQYYTSTPIKNKNNPYLYQNVLPDVESNDNSRGNYREVECNGETILISRSRFK